jgi:urocanate reductase
MAEMTRRNFVQAAALGSVAAMTPALAAKYAAAAESAQAVDEPEAYDEECDVLILGAGGTGLSAACAAADAGANVIVVDVAEGPGGTTALSGGVIQAAGTEWQKEFTDFQDDTPEKHAQCYMEQAEGIGHEDLITTMCNRAPELVEWLSTIGIKWVSVYGNCHVPYVTEGLHADRIHVYEGGGGVGQGGVLTDAEYAEAQRLGATFEFNTKALRLIYSKENGVMGAVVESDGTEKTIKASRGVILALGGIDRALDLDQSFNQQQYWDLTSQATYISENANGDGIRMGLAVNGQLASVGGTIDYDMATGNATTNATDQIPCIFVNSKGKRFVCEDATYAYTMRAIFQQETQIGGHTYMIIDGNCIEQGLSPWAEDPDSFVDNETFFKGETVEELAAAIGVPASNLQNTIDLWNQNIEESGEDLEYGRDTQLIALDKPPYYANLNISANLGSLGGMLINTDAQVIDNDGNPIPGLYAGGMNSGGWYGLYYPGSGTSLCGGLVWGHIAGESAAAADAR